MFKTLLKSVREYKKYAIMTPLLVMCETILEVVIPYLMAKLIDEGVYEGNMSNIYKFGIMLICGALLSLFFGVMSAIIDSKAGSGFGKNLRKDLYYKVQTYSFSNIDKFSASSLITRLTTDVSWVTMAFQMAIRNAVRAPFMLLSALVMAFTINKKISLIFLLLIPILAALLGLISSKAHPVFKKLFTKYDDLNNIVEENTNGIRVVKSFVLEDEEIKKFEDKSQEIYNLFSKATRILAFNNPVMEFTMYSAMIGISWVGAKIIVNSNMTELTTGQLASLITYSTQILSAIMFITMMIVMGTMALASAQRLTELLKEETDIKNPENPIEKVDDGSIEFKNVSFSYAKDATSKVLNNVNLKIDSGSTIGIIGGTGSGKSSLVNLIPRLYDVTEGELLVGGKNVKDYDLEVLRDSVSCVLQKNELFSGSIKDNIRWGNENASDEEIVEVCKLAQADKFIESFPDKYDTHIEQGGTNVSGGQKQRLCIARALLKKPKILILDDSTSAVDTKTDQLIRDAFKNKIPNTTKIIIAQRIASVQDSDKIVVLDDGKINGIGTHDELMQTNEIYREVYESQTKGKEE
ncbi:MAG: ABC transporter ATP-binding protein [Clostridia bacterium]|nr:ABC transporter ATP-binding protein [Clostridia bacterium]